MKPCTFNGRYDIVAPDCVADWDAIAHWEVERFESMQALLNRGDVLFDVGSEHGGHSSIFGKYMVGGENVCLFEPGYQFWPNLRMGWEQNNLLPPAATFRGFVGEVTEGNAQPYIREWPPEADGPECGAMAYESMVHETLYEIPTISIDDLVEKTGIVPDAISMDIEGAELLALKGARNTLIRHHPFVWISIHDDLGRRDFGTGLDDVLAFFDEVQYAYEHLATDHEAHYLATSYYD